MIDIRFSIVGLMPDEERELGVPIPMVKQGAVPREGEYVTLPLRSRAGLVGERMFRVRSTTWYPLGSFEDGRERPPFAYVVLGK